MSEFKQTLLRRTTSILFAVVLFFLILTFSIGLPIYCRFFYFAHIEPLHLVRDSNFTETEIKQSYNEVLDYLTLPNQEFKTGVMAYSPSGADHFKDCKVLFDLNAAVLICSGLLVILLAVLSKRKVLPKFTLGRHNASYYSGICAIIIPSVIGFLAALDFDKAFEVFHKIFFPNKSNWLFDPATDEIINVLPQEFFMNCAILIGASIFLFSATLIIADIIRNKQLNKTL